jgi:hypothetical protein
MIGTAFHRKQHGRYTPNPRGLIPSKHTKVFNGGLNSFNETHEPAARKKIRNRRLRKQRRLTQQNQRKGK